jgi:hypothetical protein
VANTVNDFVNWVRSLPIRRALAAMEAISAFRQADQCFDAGRTTLRLDESQGCTRRFAKAFNGRMAARLLEAERVSALGIAAQAALQ